MPPRPPLALKSRPLSAIYIGSGSTPASSPQPSPIFLNPPSPSSSIASGLPSPPATNSTGSGSTGDNNSTNAGSLRQRSPSRSKSKSTSAMSNGIRDRSYGSSRSRHAYTDDEDDANENENEEEHTAKLFDGRRPLKTATNDNMSALQRVKNLTQRNRMVLDKLSSISRLSSPAPSSRSPLSPPSIGSSSSSRISSARPRPQSASNLLPDGHNLEPSHSGSETERESQRTSIYSYSSSDDLSATPPSHPDIRAPLRERGISAPSSPARGTRRDRERAPSPGPSRTPRKRVSVAMSMDEMYRNAQQDDEADVTTAALAAVASSRRSPSDSMGKRNRQPLPKEFREKDRRSLDGKVNGEPSTPHRHSERNGTIRDSPSRSHVQGNVQSSPRRSAPPQSSTVRDLTRKHQTRWLSEDLSGNIDGEEEALPQTPNGSGRRQGHRGGSSEGLLALTSGRSLVGEGLRAAGLTRRKEAGEDPFAGTSAQLSPRRTKSTSTSSIAQGEWEPSPGQERDNGSKARVSEGIGPPSSHRHDARTPLTNSQRLSERNSRSAGPLVRPGTSMAALHHESPDHPPPRIAPVGIRSYRSSHQLADRDRIISPPAQRDFGHGNADRAYSSPFTTQRSNSALPAGTSPGLGRDSSAEHRRLMLEALGMFESHLSRLPPMGQTTTNTIPELFQSAQHVVHSLDKLNGMLKVETNKALEAQIEAEVSDSGEGVDLVELWRTVGAEHRESLRVSDEVVRNMTGFLLGAGKVLRESSALHGQQQHLRTMSLDEEMTRRSTPEVGAATGGRSSEGRKSRETRRSWDPREAGEQLARSGRELSRVRPASSLLRSSTTSSSEGRSVADAVGEQTPQTVRNGPTLAHSTSIRRLYITRDRATPESLAPITTSFDLHDSSNYKYEPSPTPTSRMSHSALSERPRAFPPVAVPPTLSTLPSESLLNRDASVSEELTRRKVSSNSNATVRADSFHPTIKPPNATTAVTPATVSVRHPPAELASPYSYTPERSESGTSSRTGMNGVTFSHPSTVSVSTLSGLQQLDGRMRTMSDSSSANSDAEPVVKLAPAAVISPLSGSETERPESWRRTVGARSRASLEGTRGDMGRIDEGASISRTSTMLSSAHKERRRTITEIFQR